MFRYWLEMSLVQVYRRFKKFNSSLEELLLDKSNQVNRNNLKYFQRIEHVSVSE